MTCWARARDGQMRTTHPHFENRCVVEEVLRADLAFKERVDAYLAGGWDAWEATRARQRIEAEPTAPLRLPAWQWPAEIGGEG